MAFLHEHIILPLSDFLTGQHVHRHLQFLLKSAQWGEAEMARFRDARFRTLIAHAATHVPFYRDLFREKGWRPQDFTCIDDLAQLPIVSKALMRHEGVQQFVADNVSPRHRIVAHSSGSTGEPFEYLISKEAYSLNTAAKLRTWYSTGYRLGDPYMKLISSPRNSIVKQLQDRVNNCTCIGFNDLNHSTLQAILQAIEHSRPSVIRTHPNIAFYLARERMSGSYKHRPQVVMTTSSHLSDAYRRTITAAFGCDVIDSYSCEGTPNCAETPQHDGYHVSREYGHVEVLGADNLPIHDGIGCVVGTDFWNLAMPFIRYNTNDIAEVQDGIITRIIGRANEELHTAQGGIITGQSICDYFSYLIHGVQAYQMVCKKTGILEIRLVTDPTFTQAQAAEIEAYWTAQTGFRSRVCLVDHIPLMHNNKCLTVIHEE